MPPSLVSGDQLSAPSKASNQAALLRSFPLPLLYFSGRMDYRVQDDKMGFRLSLIHVVAPWTARGGGVLDSTGDPPLLPK